MKKEYKQTTFLTEELKGSVNSFSEIYQIDKKSTALKWFMGLFGISILFLFLPWTQNIRAKGKVSTLRQEDRPQELNTIIPGKIEQWYVKEGDYVSKGDTILRLGEVKVDYFDPILIARTQEQITAKSQSINAYESKANTANSQMDAMREARKFKLQSIDNKLLQQNMKISSDSVDLTAANNALLAYDRQYKAAQTMLDSGAISITDLEKRRIAYQDGLAKVNSVQNKLSQARQQFLNFQIEKNSVIQDYLEKLSKTEGDRFSSLSLAANGAAEIAKLENQVANYDARRQLYFILAPQGGQITKARKSGIGEILKEGENIVEIVPINPDYAVELFVEPMDLPLIQNGQEIRFVFDGFPAIVFSGWPGSSYGTFGGIITAIETSVSSNGKFRVLVAEDPNDRMWPETLRMGGGANGIALLKDVPIYYELWRNINGFPPEYYQVEKEVSKEYKK
ncbi:MAG: multidrug efflux pump subunit AcrA (membrane-fusion protein) [Algoriphagus sp.]|jgi:multidrug efflux pump subunit AcrA (membrane-fusion protein)